MANNFKNAFATSVSTSSGSPTDVYTANNGSACNSILIELDVANTGTSAVQVSILVRDSSASASFHIVKKCSASCRFFIEGRIRTEGCIKWK